MPKDAKKIDVNFHRTGTLKIDSSQLIILPIYSVTCFNSTLSIAPAQPTLKESFNVVVAFTVNLFSLRLTEILVLS